MELIDLTNANGGKIQGLETDTWSQIPGSGIACFEIIMIVMLQVLFGDICECQCTNHFQQTSTSLDVNYS